MRRWWAIAFGVLMLASLVTIAIAWIGADSYSDLRWKHQYVGFDRSTWLFRPPREWVAKPTTFGRSWSILAEHQFAQSGPSFASDERVYGVQEVRAYGWPLRSMCVRKQVQDPYSRDAIWNVDLTWLDRGLEHPDGSQRMRLPLRPMLPGFVVNTLLAAIVMAAGIFAIGSVRARLVRDLRIRRGLCTGCGYAIGDLVVCPECGAGRP